jgi:phage FluMu protein Com
MALFRCNKCGHIREVGNNYIGKSVKCPKCDQITPIYDTVIFVKALIQKHITQTNKFQKLQQKFAKEDDSDIQIVESNSSEEFDIYNTKVLTQADKYEPIVQWFEKRQIQIQINQEAVDTTGFFDEISLLIGNNYNVLKFVSDQIKYIQNKGYTNVKLDISKKSPEEIKQIKAFCKEMYDYSFVAKYFYQKKDKIIRLTLQKAPNIRNFFNGIWMEWFTLMKLLEFFGGKKINPSCMRSLNVSFSNGISNELDIFFLTKNNIPVCIECKSGEFRQDIDKYLKLRKQLNIEKNKFVICIFGLSEKQTQGMTSMYDLTFTNETNLISHIEKII